MRSNLDYRFDKGCNRFNFRHYSSSPFSFILPIVGGDFNTILRFLIVITKRLFQHVFTKILSQLTLSMTVLTVWLYMMFWSVPVNMTWVINRKMFVKLFKWVFYSFNCLRRSWIAHFNLVRVYITTWIVPSLDVYQRGPKVRISSPFGVRTQRATVFLGIRSPSSVSDSGLWYQVLDDLWLQPQVL